MKSLTAKTFSKLSDRPGVVSDSFITSGRSVLLLPKGEQNMSDWIWGGGSECAVACLIRPDMFSAVGDTTPTGQEREANDAPTPARPVPSAAE